MITGVYLPISPTELPGEPCRNCEEYLSIAFHTRERERLLQSGILMGESTERLQQALGLLRTHTTLF